MRLVLTCLALCLVAQASVPSELLDLVIGSSPNQPSRHFGPTGKKPSGKVQGKKPGKVSAGTCYNTGRNSVNMRSSACGSTVLATIPSGTTVASAGNAATLTSCSLGNYLTWYYVTYGSRSGYIASSLVSIVACSSPAPPTPTPPPSGSGWLTSAGSYTVENLDRTRRGYSTGAQSTRLNKFLLHTIEGRWPSYGDWEGGTATLDSKGYWPHFIVAHDRSGRLRVGQYLPMQNYARALKTGNHDGVVQVEIGGKAASPFTSNDAGLRDAVKALYAAVSRATGIPITLDSRVRFVGNSAWGLNAAQRLDRPTFIAVSGLVGHQHVYGNSHWDPGAIDPNALM